MNMNKKHNRLIATARQYALVTFLGLGMSFAVVKAAFKSQKLVGMADQEWLLTPGQNPTEPGSYTSNDPEFDEPLSEQCKGTNEVCGIIAPANGSEPYISPELMLRISQKDTDHDDVFLQP